MCRDLFDGSRQLVLYRFCVDPDMDVYPERSCPGCSMYADQLNNLLHLREREHMGWEFPWYSGATTHPIRRPGEWGDWQQTPPYTWGGWYDEYDHTL